MKQLFLAAILCAALTNATFGSDEHEFCPEVGASAEKIMWARQHGGTMSDLMAIVEGDRLLEQVVVAAFAQPLWDSDEFKRSAVLEFRNEVELICYQER